METQSEHWPNLLGNIIYELNTHVTQLNLKTLYEGISLMSKLLSCLAPSLGTTEFNTVFPSPPTSPLHKDSDVFDKETFEPNCIKTCAELSKILFAKFTL